jgi:predicted transcriptional regulator
MSRKLTTIRIPPDAKAFLEAQAEKNCSSQNSEIVRAIREMMKAKELSTEQAAAA